MMRIQILPPHIANQIAAGEVVERPASVVKELCENAIDAGAQRVRIDLEDGGKAVIRVVDDGAGMGRQDVELAVERHATSKIREETDLFAISTLGFRGEALPSIAAVSRLTVTSRPAKTVEGWRVRVDFGLGKAVEAVGCPAGTTVEVEDLFLKIPARRRFLKGRQTELGHAAQVVRLLAVSHPEIHFELLSEGRAVFRSRPGSEGARRIEPLLGAQLAGRLIHVEAEGPGLGVSGYIGPPDEGRASSRAFYFFLNGRPIVGRLLWRAVREAYRGRLMRDVYPVGALFLRVPPERVDVNVHPAKQEVRFHDPESVYRAVYNAIRRGLEGARLVEGLTEGARAGGEQGQGLKVDWVAEALPPSWGAASGGEGPRLPPPAGQGGEETATAKGMAFGPQGDLPPLASPAPGVQAAEAAFPPQGLRVIGQLARSYILAEAGEGLLLIDQHAAHEGLLFARLMREVSSGEGLPAQPLLFPQVLERPPGDLALLPGVAPVLKRMGLVVDAFGPAQLAVRAVPGFLVSDRGATETISAMLDRLFAHPEQAVETLVHDLVATLACHSAVRANLALAPEEMEALLDEVAAEGVVCCPHGRPVAQSLGLAEIRRRFGRT